MGKPLDSRIVEYAYVSTLSIQPNIFVAPQAEVSQNGVVVVPAVDAHYQTRVSISYELLTPDKKFIRFEAVDHVSTSDAKLTTVQLRQLFNDNFRAYVQADKLALSGYQEA